jgi:hypothetical protein
MFDVPVALFFFNRPKEIVRVMDVLRQVRPSRLFAIADGPRKGSAKDHELCTRARTAVEAIDWKCEIRREYSSDNLGVRQRLTSGLATVFGDVDEAIILEDDCLPDPTFFRFCEDLLKRYRREERVTMVSGSNPLGRWRADAQSYFFSPHGTHWGWATWKRAWRRFDPDLLEWKNRESRERLRAAVGDEFFAYYSQLVDRVVSGGLDTWDCQWTVGQILDDRLAVVPSVNLISNIGFGGEATHTRNAMVESANSPRYAMEFPLRPPPAMQADHEFDTRYRKWRRGKPDAETLLDRGTQLLEANRSSQALLLAQAALRAGIDANGEQRERLRQMREQAVAVLRKHRGVGE